MSGSGDGAALVEDLRDGRLSCVEVATEVLRAIDDDKLNAWAARDPELLLARSAELDRIDRGGRAALPLFGMPVGIKDCFDVADLPTTYGSPIYHRHRPRRDAHAVTLLRQAGAMIVGTTKCAEFAWMHAADTLNPLDHERTPGGSSSGSAAAVAAGWVPVATGTQTAGSINRPASFCGILGYKPTFGSFPRAGVKPLAGTLDTVGLLARTVRDLRLVSSVLAAEVRAEPSARRAQPFDPSATPRDRPLPSERWRPRLGFARTPDWDAVEAECRNSIERLVDRAADAGAEVSELTLSARYPAVVRAQQTIQRAEASVSLGPELERSPDALSAELRQALLEGQSISLREYRDARSVAAAEGAGLAGELAPYDAVLTPSAPGVPPLGLHFTGDPLFCRAWTLVGAPCVSVPLAWTAAGLPAPVQVVAEPFQDGAVLAVAEWLTERLGNG